MISTVFKILQTQANNQPNSDAILGLEKKPTNYLKLFTQAQNLTNFLSTMEIGRNDPVAIVLPNGPLMAVAFLSIACSAASAPLNPSYTAPEYDFYLKDLNAKALITESGSQSPAIKVAQQLSIPIIYISQKEDEAAGFFLITDKNIDALAIPNQARPSDIALILHTSGTTSRPKMVPLTQKNLCASAENIRYTLQLTPEDRCLNIMPLFHIHGLMAAVLASIMAGASIVCTPGFYAPRFFEWMDHFQPTWYTAVPTMHQAILNRAQDNLETIRRSSLRFIRSSSASLAPNVMADIEATFSVPVIESYGMTEAAHQMASNPLPAGIRKPGSVGLAAGPEIAVMHEDQPTLLPQSELGEVVIRGDNVTLGYMNNPEANTKSYAKGWFRTGDQGYQDDEGYLFLTGRLKEIINRGGEKISPREVDEVLLKHPAVEQAVTFGIPDETLGENIAAAVVLINPSITEQELKQFAAAHLANHKIPNRIVFLDEIPKGPTGKLQRIGLAEQLGFGKLSKPKFDKKTIFTAPQTKNEQLICDIWQKILDFPKIGINDDFRKIGGDSMLATLIHVEMEAIFGINISLIELFAARTVYEQSKLIEAELSNTQDNNHI